MKYPIEESRRSTLAQWTTAVVLALGPSSCVSPFAPRDSDYSGANGAAEFVAGVDALAEELTGRASLRIPLGSARVFVDDPVAVPPASKRYWPAHWAADEWRATRAALELELQIALANRMNVVGAHRHTSAAASGSGIALAAVDGHDAHSDATHALLTTFVQDGVELELTVQLVECDSGWIVATARRRIVGFSPSVYAAQLDPPVATATDERVAIAVPAAQHTSLAELAAHAEPSTERSATTARGASEGSVPMSPTPLSACTVRYNGDIVQNEGIEGPAAMRRRALDRIANEVAARVGGGTP